MYNNRDYSVHDNRLLLFSISPNTTSKQDLVVVNDPTMTYFEKLLVGF